ncbi:MAG TPA: RHS repeat-associated core domain-containing protein [Streptosporangiaceae bacterium]|nr:RHS repeat-associated core domain-containing protein [Streptosporangiaceae bacterium]
MRLDYSGFTQAFGGSYGSRLRLEQLPGCAITTPERAACRTATPVATTNNGKAQTLTADVDAATSGATVLAAAAAPSGSAGDYKATSLSASATWKSGGSSGDFTWSYPMRVPPVPGGLAPQVAVSYSSGSVDGRTANANNQPSWVGEGFDLWPGYIQRGYKSCEDDGAPKDQWGNSPGDQCWGYDNATITWNGKGGELIPAGSRQWRLKDDDGTRIEELTDTATGNGDNDGEHWKLTTTDGTQYFFGKNKLPNWTSGSPQTRSTWTTPVYGDDPGEPCYDSGGFAASWCRQAWRWNLDYVVDPHGNAIAYYYTPETNHYGRNLKPEDETSYERGGHLDHIEYGLRSSSLFAKAPARVDFGVSERCIRTTAADCDPSNITTHPDYWWDVPWDLHCDSGQDCMDDHGTVSPTFWSRKRLTKVTTRVLKSDGATYRDVESWSLTHDWGLADIDRDLLLTSITHTGDPSGTPVSLPPVTFTYGSAMPNRVDKLYDDIPPFLRYRLGSINDESGGIIDVNYSAEDCKVGDVPTPETNTRRCYPVYWQPAGHDDPIRDWFHKYVAVQVIQTDRTGGAPDIVTNYDYQDGAAWHYDDDDGLIKEKNKTWSQWRGYGKVVETSGGWNDMRSQTDHSYFRGMDGDRLNTSGGTKDVIVSDGEVGTYDDHDSLAGMEVRTVAYDRPGGTVVTKTVNSPWHHQTASRARSWGTVTANLTGVHTTRTLTALSGGGWRETKKSTEHDTTTGLAVEEEDLGDTAAAADDRCSTIGYAQNTDAWLMNYPSRRRVVALSCDKTPTDLAAQLISDERTSYDGGSFGAAPSQGDVTKVEKAASASGTTVSYVTQALSSYDTYGRVRTATDAANNTTTTTYTDTSGLNTGTTVTTPPVVAGDVSTALTTSQVLDPAFGAPLSKTDAGGKITTLAYDGLGRLTKVWLPNRTTAASPNLEFAYTVTDGQPVAVATKTITPTGLQKTTYELYDGLLRSRQIQAPGPGGTRLISDSFYGSHGKVSRAYQPYNAAGAPSTALFGVDTPGNVETQTAYDYDGLGRVTTERLLVGNGSSEEKWRTTTSYGGDRVNVDPPAGGTPTTTILDARDQKVELRQYKGDSPTGAYDSTSYAYTPAGQLKTVNGFGGNTWTYTYDLRGRKIQSTDPDTGTTTTGYDDLDRVTSTEDGRGRKLAFTYDPLGRKTGEYETSTSGPKLAEWTYDTARKGQPATATRFSGGAAYTIGYSFYDNLNRPLRTTYTIPSIAGEEKLAGSYTFGTTYNLDDTVQGYGFPAGGGLAAESVVIGYDADNLKRPVRLTGNLSSYVTNTNYSATGKPQQYELSTGGAKTWLTLGYEYGTQRLHESRTDRENIAGVDRDAVYGYDDAGNVIHITDTSRSGVDNQCFRYDHLRRLTDASAQRTATCAADPSGALGGPAPYWHTYTYDTAGNRKTETSHNADGSIAATRTYTYPPAGQGHRLQGVTQTGAGAHNESYGYDASGNTTTRDTGTANQTLTWDGEGKLTKIADAAAGDTSYLYDAGGNRLLRRDSAATTLSMNTMELRLDKATNTVRGTRYYLHNGQTVATRTTSGAQFLAADHHGTAEEAIDATTQALTQRRFTPFGQPRGATQGTWPGDKSFVGGTADPTGLTHLGAREYDPATGRFISVDPLFNLDYPQSWDGYSYANNTPVTMSDPDGLDGPLRGNKDCYYAGKGCDKPKPNGGWDGDEPRYPEPAFPALPEGKQRKTQYNQRLQALRDAIQDARDLQLYMQGKIAFCSEYPGEAACKATTLHDDLNTLGLIPGVGDPADIVNGALYAAEGKWGMAALSAASAIPNIGYLGNLFKWLRKAKPAAKACNSFIAGTQVLMANGKRKPIEKVRVGDKVLATDPKTGETRTQRVIATFSGASYDHLVQITIDTDGTRGHKTGVIVATEHHLFWNPRRHQWLRADQLALGSILRTPDKVSLDVIRAIPYPGHPQVHDLTVADAHTFYVEAGTRPVLVHNCGFDLDAMSAAGRAQDKNGLTVAGRAYQKHMDRGELPMVGGADLNTSGQNLLDDILTDPHSDFQGVTKGAFKGGTRVISNRIIGDQFVGAVYDARGSLQYFGLFS